MNFVIATGSLEALERIFPVTRAMKPPSKSSDREASHKDLLQLLQDSNMPYKNQGSPCSDAKASEDSLTAQVLCLGPDSGPATNLPSLVSYATCRGQQHSSLQGAAARMRRPKRHGLKSHDDISHELYHQVCSIFGWSDITDSEVPIGCASTEGRAFSCTISEG